MAQPLEVEARVEERTRGRVKGAGHVVVKIGSNVLVQGGPSVVNRRVFTALVESLATLSDGPGREITLVSSGSVALGRRTLGVAQRLEGESLAVKQALAAVGQPGLMNLYAEEFGFYGKNVAQILLTRSDVETRERYLNARHTLRELLRHGNIIPVVNENDTVANAELRFGDNDQLAALVTSLIETDVLILLSDVDGLYDADPSVSPNAKLVPVVYADDTAIDSYCGEARRTGYGIGGMVSKVRAARMAGAFGVPTIVAPGRTANVVGRILSGEEIGTLFVPRDQPLNARKAWIRFASRAEGVIHVDAGAADALTNRGKSLLPGGITEIEGTFDTGAAVEIRGPDKKLVAKGLAGYSGTELRRIQGHKTDKISSLLGYYNGDEAIHRDDLVLVAQLRARHRRVDEPLPSKPGPSSPASSTGFVAQSGRYEIDPSDLTVDDEPDGEGSEGDDGA